MYLGCLQAVLQRPAWTCCQLAWLLLLAIALLLTPAQAQTAPEARPALSPEGELLLDVRLDGQPLGVAILGYRQKERFFLALSELMDALRFPVNVDAAAGRAGGWFISEERAFSLDLGRRQVRTRGDTLAIEPGQVRAFQGELFVESRALAQWFPITLTPEIRQLTLEVGAREPLPVQAKMARASGRARFGRTSTNNQPVLPFQPTPYRALGPHATDLRLNLNSVLEDNDDSSTSYGGNYSVLSRGDLLWMTSTIALSGNKDDELSDGRFKLERSSLDGPLALEHVEVGDVDVGRARGLLIRGGGAQEGMTGLFADEQVDLRGNLPPDWEVELYRNGVLIDFQVVGGESQYEFLDVPLEFGENRFEFIAYGPFGEERSEERIVYAGRSALELGEISYELAAVQDGRTVFDVGNVSTKGDVNTGRYLGNFNVGLASNAVATLGIDSFELGDERYQDYSAGLSVNFARLQANAGYRDRALAQNEATGLLRSRLGNTSASLRYTQYFKDGLDAQWLPNDRTRWSSVVSVSSREGKLPLNLEAFHTERDYTRASAANIGTTFGTRSGVRLSKSFYYDRSNSAGITSETVGGALSVSGSFRPWRFRTGLGYDLSPETEITSVNASANLRVDAQMTMNFDVNHSAQTDYTVYRAGFNWLLDYIQVSPQVVYDSNERWVGLLSLSTSFNPRPGKTWPHIDRLSQTGYGAAYAKAFLDNNGNGRMDPGDQPLAGVRMDAAQAWHTDETDANGQAYLMRLPRDRVTDIAVDPGSLENIELTPASPGVSIRPRPGSWSEVNVPVIRNAELEGHVYTQEAGAPEGQVPVERARVTLTNKAGEVVASQRTAFDGFFLFSEVPPGVYQLALGERLQPRVSERPTKVGVNAQGGIIRDLDFVLTPPKGRQLVGVGQPEAKDEPAPGPAFAPESGTSRAVPVLEPAAEARLQPQPASRQSEQSDKTPDGNWYVQLGAFSEQENARTYWRKLQADDVIPQTYSLKLQTTGQLFRLLAGPGQPEAGARKLCRQVKAAGGDCLVRELANP